MSNFTKLVPGSYEQIRTIHTKGAAVPNKLYYGYGKDGTLKTYRGTHEGRLKEETNLVSNETATSDNKDNIDSNDIDITALQAEDARLEAAKADKCYVSAMMLLMG
jgi:hypothetical protein